MLASLARRRAVALVLVATWVEACSTSAAIERRSGPTIVGHIDSSDVYRLYVTGDDGRPYAIERWDVLDIDHPGTIGSIAGGIATGFGASFLLLAPRAHQTCPPEATDCWGAGLAIFMGITCLAVGLPILLRAMAVHSRSQAAAEPPTPIRGSASPQR
jgi:hypothetical protein